MQKTFGKFLREYSDVVALAAYFLLALVMTFPVIFNLNRAIPKWGSDAYQVIAQMETQKTIFVEKGIFEGFSFLGKTYQLNVFTPYAVLDFFTNKFFAYNFWFIFSFVLSALGAYLLSDYFLKNHWAAFLAGLIFAFAPFHMYQAMSINVGTMHQEWLPFFVLFLFKFFEKFQLKYFTPASLFVLLITITEHQLLAFTALFVTLFLIWQLSTRKEILKNKQFLGFVFGAVGLLAFVAITFFYPLIKVAVSQENYLAVSVSQARQYSAKFLDPLVPPAFNSIWPSQAIAMQEFFLGGGRGKVSYFLGYSVLLLLGVAFFQAFKKKNQAMLFWILAFFVFYLFSLGPIFVVGKNEYFLPYYLIYKYVPFFENIRTTGRFFVYVMLAASVLAGYGFTILLAKIKEKKPKFQNFFLIFFFSLIVLLEFSAIPLSLENLAYSQFYDLLACDPEQYSILEIPGSTEEKFASFALMTNLVHKKNPVNGMPFARKIEHQFDFQRNTPIIRDLLYTLPNGISSEKRRPDGYFDNANKVLTDNNIRYITINKRFLAQKNFEKVQVFIEKYLKYDSKYEDEYLIAYKISQ